MPETLRNTPYLDRPLRSEGDARMERAATLVPIARALFEMAKAQADAIGRLEGKMGSDHIRHLYGQLTDIWMACESFASDHAKAGE